MIGFSVRNLRVFFKDRSSVFFSLLSVLIIIGLYALFLGDVWLSGMKGVSGARFLMDSWIMAGLLSVVSVTSTMGAYGIMVEDQTKKIYKDFRASPMSSRSLLGGYIAGAVIIGIVMSLVTLALAEVYVVAEGGELLGLAALWKVLGLIVLSTFANSSIILFIVSFFRSTNAFATASTVIGTLIGFLTGIYLPVGNLPVTVQWIVKCFPVSHAAALFRQIMMAAPISQSFAGAPAQALSQFEQFMGVTFKFGEGVISPWLSAAVLITTAAVFYSLALFNLSRKKKS